MLKVTQISKMNPNAIISVPEPLVIKPKKICGHSGIL